MGWIDCKDAREDAGRSDGWKAISVVQARHEGSWVQDVRGGDGKEVLGIYEGRNNWRVVWAEGDLLREASGPLSVLSSAYVFQKFGGSIYHLSTYVCII